MMDRVRLTEAVHFGSQLLRYSRGIDAVTDDLRPNENDQLRSFHRRVSMTQKIPKQWQLFRARHIIPLALAHFAD